MTWKQCAFVCALLAGIMGQPALAQPAGPENFKTEPELSDPGEQTGMVSIRSSFSALKTTDRLALAIEARGMKVFSRIDHQAGAASAKLSLRPTTLLIFGSPVLGTQLMHQNQTIGLDLPLKFLVWQAGDGGVYISWNNPYYLAQRHGIPKNFALLSKMSQNLTELAKTAAGGN